MNIPTEKTIVFSDAERFIEGLKMLAEECNMTNVTYNGLGPVQFSFRDGSVVGTLRAAFNAGWISENEYDNEFNAKIF